MDNEISFTLLSEPRFPIPSLADDRPCVWGVYYLGGQPLGIIWACPNGTANFIVANRAQDTQDADLEADKFRQQIFELQMLASGRGEVFDSLSWIDALPDDYSGMTGRSFKVQSSRLRFEELELRARTL